MKSFDECLIKFNTKVEEFIKEYKLLDDKAPFTLDIIEEITKIFNENYDESINEVNTYEKRKNKLDESFNKILSDYYKLEKQRNNDLKGKQSTIKKELDEKIKTSKSELNALKKQYEKSEFETLNDISFYVDSSNQNIDMFEIEYKDNINRFAYQIGVAKSSYNSNIDTFNSQLELQLEKVKAEYDKNMRTNHDNFNALVESYNLVIDEKNELIENKQKEYNEAKIELNNKKRQEYVLLNNQIKELSNEKNDKISVYRNTYTEAQNKDNVEKEKSNNDYKAQNFKANKDFVKNINELDNKIRDIREKFENYCQELNQNKYYNIYDLHVEQEKLIKQFLESEANSNKVKQEIKRINKIFYDRMVDEDKRTEKIIKSAEKEYLSNTKKEMYQKKLLDISRNSFFSRLTEKQTRDNKYYQEKNNGYEDVYNYHSSVANNVYNKHANKALLESSIRNLEIEKEIDEIDAKFQIQIETLSDVIKKYQLEIQIARRLNELNDLFLTEKYNREVSFLTVSNLLKIEKCKVLDIYNINQYELNIKNSKNVLDYSKNKIRIQNDKYKSLKQQDILIQNKQLEMIVSKTSFDEYSINYFATNDLELLKKEYNYTTSLNKSKLLREKYIVELDEYQNVLQSYIIIHSNMVKSWNDIIDYIFDNITETKNRIVKKFISTLQKEFKELLNNLNDTYKELVSNEIDHHLKFDNDFKYKEHFENHKKVLNGELDIVRRQKEALVYELERYKQRNDDLRLKLFTSQYESAKNKDEKKTKRTNERLYMKELKSNLIVINDLEAKVDELAKKNEEIEKKYSKKYNTIKSEQDIDNAPYQLYSNNVIKLHEEIKEFINKKESSDELDARGNYKKDIRFISKELTEQLFNNTSTFSNKYQENYDASIKKINENYESDLESYKSNSISIYEKAKEKFNKDNQTDQNILKTLINEKTEIEKNYDNTIRRNDITHKKEINEILLSKKQNTNQFYVELYAVGDNLHDIEADYEEFLKNHTTQYEITKQNIIDETIRLKESYNESLKNYINNRKAIINHLPSAIKANEKELRETYKQKNKELDLKSVQAKKDLNTKARLEKKNLNIIEVNYNTALVKITAREKYQKAKEKKSLSAELAKAN